MPFRITVMNPSSQMVGDGPIEKIIRNIIDPANVRIPFGRGTVNIVANDINITVQISPDKWEFSSEKSKAN